jgi:hypothetical protein
MLTRKFAAVVFMAALLAAGCTSSTDTPVGDGASEDIGEIGVEASSAPALIAQKTGTPFPYQQTFSDDSKPVDWEVTVDKIECGIPVLKKAAENPAYNSGEWDSENVPPQTIDAKAPKGQAFCRMDASLKNVGRAPAGSAEGFGNLETDQGEFASRPEDDMYTTSNLLELEKAPTGPFNPGATAKVIKIWTVPADAKPQAILFPDTNVYSEAEYRIAIG